MPTIDIDDDVFARLQTLARPLIDTPSDVIRRLLADAEVRSSESNGDESLILQAKSHPDRGRLETLIARGLVAPGDLLTHHRKRSNRTFHAYVTAGGRVMVVGGETFAEPSPALRHFVGSQVDGWNNLVHARSGRTLRDLRDNG